jgi:large subunit ribosomal protein L1
MVFSLTYLFYVISFFSFCRLKLNLLSKHIDDSWKAIPTDDVYIGRYYRWPVYTIEQAIKCHRETHDPTMYNRPNEPLNVEIELNMVAEKATRFLDNFQRMAMIPHGFDHGEDRKIIAFVKGQDLIKEATDAGAALVGGVELIKDLQSGGLDLSIYSYVVAHPNILPELVTLRGLMKRKFPNPKNGTLGTNVGEIVQKFLNGIQYSATKDENQQDFGLISTTIGYVSVKKIKKFKSL